MSLEKKSQALRAHLYQFRQFQRDSTDGQTCAHSCAHVYTDCDMFWPQARSSSRVLQRSDNPRLRAAETHAAQLEDDERISRESPSEPGSQTVRSLGASLLGYHAKSELALAIWCGFARSNSALRLLLSTGLSSLTIFGWDVRACFVFDVNDAGPSVTMWDQLPQDRWTTRWLRRFFQRIGDACFYKEPRWQRMPSSFRRNLLR